MYTSSNLIPPNAFYGQTTNKGFEYSGEEHPNTLIQDTYTKAQCIGLKRKARHDTSHEFHRNIKCRANSVTRDENMSRVRYYRNGNELFTDLQLEEKTDNRSPTRGGHRSPVRHHTPLGTNPRRAQPSDMKTSRRSYKRKATGGDTHPARKRGRCSSSIGHHHTQERTRPMSTRPKPLKLTQPPITCFMLRRVKGTVGRPPNSS